MDAPSVAETLPDAYRAVLDRVADLETAGYRREADLIRRDAIAAYSRRWNARTSVRLARLGERAARVLDGRDRPRLRYATRHAAAIGWLAAMPARLRRSAGAATHRGTRQAPVTREQPAA